MWTYYFIMLLKISINIAYIKLNFDEINDKRYRRIYV